MEARFYVEKVYTSQGNNYIVIDGKVAEGMICKNMCVLVPFNRELSMESPIDDVQVSEKDPKRLKLFICCDDEDEIGLWMGLNIGNEFVIIKKTKQNF